MKISELNIYSYKHLENLKFDFKYPKDYKDKNKAGKPLDKICFLGQSATGKTKLLELIYEFSTSVLNLNVINHSFIGGFKSEVKKLNGEIKFLINDKEFTQKDGKIHYNNKSYGYDGKGGLVTSLIPESEKNEVLFLTSGLISDRNLEIFAKNPIDIVDSSTLKLEEIEINFKHKDDYGILLNQNVSSELWLFLLLDILDYRKKFTQKMSELINKGFLANKKRLSNEFDKWQKDNPNILEDFAKKFNPLLEKLNLEIDLVNTEYAIPIFNKKNEETIPMQSASTGTKGLLLSFLPLFKLNTTNSIILMDEPERSLYPDMQIGLIDHYTNVSHDAEQFIIATHSPFIAASFEPEERFILFFDDDGKVQVKRGESPIGDDPNDLLTNDFGINYYNKFGENAYKNYLELKNKVANEKDSKKKKKLMLEMVKLGDEYNF